MNSLSYLSIVPGLAKWISKSEKYCRPPWLAEKKHFRILDALEWLKQ